MSDLAITWDDGTPDLAFVDGDLVADDSLQPAVAVSLFTDAQALPADAIPDGTTNRRGFWGDSIAPDAGLAGSRLWLLGRNKLSNATLQQARADDLAALQWLLDTGEATAIDADVSSPQRDMELHEISITPAASTAPETISLIAPGGQVS